MPLPIEQCRAVVEALDLPYPLYADPTWSAYRAYGSGHVLFGPKQLWTGIDADGTIRWLWRIGDLDDDVPLGGEALAALQAALA